jgi:hypothetical protein
MHPDPSSKPGPKARVVLPTSPAECLRRAALAEEGAARVAFEVAHDRLLELADWWRRQAQALVGEPRTFQDRSFTPLDVQSGAQGRDR